MYGIIGTIIWTTIGLIVMIAVAIAVLLLLSLRVVKEDQMGVKVVLGKIKLTKPSEKGEKGDDGEVIEKIRDPKNLFERLFFGFCDSGLRIGLRFPNSGIIRLPKRRFEIDYPPYEIMSGSGEPPKETSKETPKENLKQTKKEDPKKAEKSKISETQEVVVDGTGYMQLGRDYKSAVKAIEKGAPTTEAELKKKTDSVVQSALGRAVASMSYNEALSATGRKAIERIASEILRDKKGYLVSVGFDPDTISIRIKNIVPKSKALRDEIAAAGAEAIRIEAAKDRKEQILIKAEAVEELRAKFIDATVPPDRATELAASIYELEVGEDTQKRTGQKVLNILRISGGYSGKAESNIAEMITKAAVSYAMGRKIVDEDTKTGGEKETEKKKEEKENNEGGKNKLDERLKRIKKRFDANRTK